MDEKEALKKIQSYVDEKAKKFVRTALIKIVHSEKKDNKDRFYCLGDDQPNLVFRVFDIDDNGTVNEVESIEETIECTRHFRTDILPTLDLVLPAVQENDTFDLVLENPIDNGGVEIKLKSSVGREITMLEIYRYFDYVSKIFFVSCISLSYGGQYLFSVVPGGKQVRLLLTDDKLIRSRVDMITELLQNRALPSYRTIEEGNGLLEGQVKAQITLTDDKNVPTKYQCNFCYDDPQTQSRFAFFAKLNDKGEEDTENRGGVILIADIFNNNNLIVADKWSEEQKNNLEVIREKMRNNDPEVQNHIVSYFADDLDFRFKAFKDGTLFKKDENSSASADNSNTEAK